MLFHKFHERLTLLQDRFKDVKITYAVVYLKPMKEESVLYTFPGIWLLTQQEQEQGGGMEAPCVGSLSKHKLNYVVWILESLFYVFGIK